MATYREIIGGLSILQKHAEKGADSHDVEGQHDIIFGGEGEGLSPEERAELERLGWFVDDETDCWAHYT